MTEGLAFELKGKTAFFKHQDVNMKTMFSYDHIHKVALLGILGAIIGCGGYNTRYFREKVLKEMRSYPEFYEKLRHLDVAIVPRVSSGVFEKHMSHITNFHGLSSTENGENTTWIQREKWLENVHWTIYVKPGPGLEEGLFEDLRKRLDSKRYVFHPYLGKNDHPATISNVRSVCFEKEQSMPYFDSLFDTENVLLGDVRDIEDDDTPLEEMEDLMPVLLVSSTPVALTPDQNLYISKEVAFTNLEIVNQGKPVSGYRCQDDQLYDYIGADNCFDRNQFLYFF